LHQNKKINIFDTIGKYNFDIFKSISNLKIIDIVNHKSGLKNWFNGAIYGSSKIKYNNVTEVYEKWNDGNLIDDTLKNTFAYSNIGYIVLGTLIEKITNTTYSEFVTNNILIPLKMNNSGQQDCNITLYDHKLNKLNKYQKWERTFAGSSGQLKSCIIDLIKFSKFVKLIDKSTLKLLKDIYIFHDSNNEYHISHSGGIAGGKSELHYVFNKKFKIKSIYISLTTGYF
jgi:CubicO group peptidase (beta-lactamase class C family)